MKKIIALGLTILLILPVAAACSGKAEAGVVKSDKERITSLDVSPATETQLTAGNGAFAFDLYRQLSNKDGNLFYSPYSISQALAMTWAGARSETAREMAETLHFNLSQDNLHPAFNSLDSELGKRGIGAGGRDEKGFRLNIVNAIWGQENYVFLPEFLDVLAENYGAGLRTLDFSGDTEQSRLTINNWVSDQTEARIKDLIPQGVIDPSTRLVLTNAIYFNAAWQHKFSEGNTKDRPFYLLDNREVSIPMMRQVESFGYAEGDKYQALELPYDGRELSMVIIMPDAGEFKSFEDSLDYQKIAAIIGSIQSREIVLTMPKFEFETEFTLKDVLSDMGMPSAFGDGADFSGMTGTPDLVIDEVIHKAFVLVDEKGTEAAAATGVVMEETAAAIPIEVTLDHPFIFLIRDIETGTILFVGRFVNPG